ncbi:alpha-mannosidase [Metabacillus hrfriensis]|uniref:Glycoside hydrolase family 38 C-terminal domain-containing protein n=1 Tax=Metabacillus hrfriensis TaxID=3048891 RepID=A0ACD4R6F1_9BACI|nr:alpha-mannosidase [Metabacillus sp. CT-WN-B3]WHZ56039.1 glycoside hydrolase family 38 C-terminal domain-containing protein [Metabacillus sp. CT-WN-B3]
MKELTLEKKKQALKTKDQTLHMIGNAHLDPVWLWQWQEGFQETKATFRSALDRMKEYDDFVFTSSSAANYEWIENNEPEMFEEIKERIKQGRWEIVGGWWVQPDCNIPGGESFVRQGLYGQHYFKEKFGVTAKVGYNVDSFGHHGMLPQILKKSGMDQYIFMRPSPQEKGLPNRLFWWESDDGSRVLTYRIPFEYCTWGKELDQHVRRTAGEIRAPFNDLMCFYGVGNHGGGPTKENIESISRLNDDSDFPKLVLSTPNRFFEEVLEKNLPFPIVHDDFQHHASGCYAVHSGIKKWNREAENLLSSAEKFSAIANWTTGQKYPFDYNLAWKNVLFNQFHDILAGTSLEAAYEDARNMHGEAMSIVSRGLNYAIQSLSWRINIEEEEGMKPIVVFNPHSWSSKVNVELEVGGLKPTDILVDDERNQVAMQTVQSWATSGGRYRISFMADLPPLGYRVYKIVKQNSEHTFPTIKANDHLLENENYRVEIDPKTGFVTSLYDKNKNLELLDGPAARPVVINDKSDTWSHNVLQYKEEIGVFTAKSVQRVEHGPVKSVIRVVSEYGKSTLIQDFVMYREKNQIDVSVTLNWQEQFKMLKLKFPVNLVFRKGTYEIPYGHIVRECNGEEEPGQSWIDLSGTHQPTGEMYGLSLLNDGKYSFDIHNKEMSITVLRSPIYAHHDPLIPQEEGHYSFIDQGIQKFTYSLFPHEGNWETAGTVQRAAELNQKPTSIIETYHSGVLPQKDSFLSVDVDNVIVSVIKKAEENDDIIIRCYESTNRAAEAKIELPKWNRTIVTGFKPCEIKTFRIPKDRNQPVIETNLLEWTE